MKKPTTDNRAAEIASIARGDMLRVYQNPENWMIKHSQSYGDVLIKLIEEKGIDDKTKMKLAKKWMEEFGANPTKSKSSFLFKNKSEFKSNQGINAIKNTPIYFALKYGYVDMAKMFLSKPWNYNIHGNVFTFCAKEEREDMMEFLWKKIPALDRIKELKLQDVLWSQDWINKFLDKGITLTDSTTQENLRQWFDLKVKTNYFHKQNHEEVYKLVKDGIEKLIYIDDYIKNNIIRRSKKQKYVNVDWNEVILWTSEFQNTKIDRYVLNLSKQKNLDISDIFNRIINRCSSFDEVISIIDKYINLVHKNKYTQILGANTSIQNKSDFNFIDSIIKYDSDEITKIMDKTIEKGFNITHWRLSLENKLEKYEIMKTKSPYNFRLIEGNRVKIMQTLAIIDGREIRREIDDNLSENKDNENTIVKKRKM